MEPLGDRVVPATLALWNFNSPSPDGNVGTGTTTVASGSGTLTTIGGVSTAYFTGGTNDLAGSDNSGLSLAAFPSQSTANKTAGLEVAVDTTGYGAVVLTFDQRNSPTASSRGVVQYSLDGGGTWTDQTTLTLTASGVWANGRTVDLSGVAGANDNPNLRLRIVSAFDGSAYAGTSNTYGTGGTWRFDMLSVDATALPSVTVAKIADAAEGGTAGTLRFTRTGSTTAALTVSYAVSGTATADVTVAALHDGVTDDDETVSVTVTSGIGYSVGSPASDSVTLIDTDILPVAFDGWVTTSVNEDADVEVLDLATSLYGDTLTVTGVTDGDHGTVVINLDGTVTYTPDTDFVGDDAFTYTVEDPFGNEATGTVSVTVTAPVAPPTSVWTATNSTVIVGVLDLAFDPDGDTLTTTAVTQGAHGSVVINLDGTVTYTPNTSFTGDDSFTYTVEDPDGNEATHTITVTVGPTDPVALDNAVQTDTDTAVIVSLADLAFQPAGGSVTFTVSSAAHGTVVDNFDGTVTYTPDASYTGTDSFSYFVADASLSTASGTITVTVGPMISPASNVLANLHHIDTELSDYNNSSASIISSVLSSLEDHAADFQESITSHISTNNIFDHGAGQPYRIFMNGRVATFRVYSTLYSAMLSVENATWNVLVSNKTLIDGLWELYNTAKAANNRDLMIDRLKKINEAMSAHADLLKIHRNQRDAVMELHKLALAEYKAMRLAQPAIGGLFSIPDPPPARTRAQITPTP
jgi:VCBS repeat-containing protein